MIMQRSGAANRIAQNGTFRLPNVAPGRYQLQVRAAAQRRMELARMDLVVGTEEVEGLTLVTAPGATVSGTIVSDTGEAFDFRTQLQVSGRAATPEVQGMGPGGGLRIGDDWTFTLLNVADPIVIRTSAPQGWMLKSVFNGQDITDIPMEFPPGQSASGVQIVMTKKIASVSGGHGCAR